MPSMVLRVRIKGCLRRSTNFTNAESEDTNRLRRSHNDNRVWPAFGIQPSYRLDIVDR